MMNAVAYTVVAAFGMPCCARARAVIGSASASGWIREP